MYVGHRGSEEEARNSFKATRTDGRKEGKTGSGNEPSSANSLHLPQAIFHSGGSQEWATKRVAAAAGGDDMQREGKSRLAGFFNYRQISPN